MFKYRFSWVVLIISIFLLANCTADKDANSTSQAVGEGLTLLSPEETGVTFNNLLDDDPTGDRNVLSFPHYYNGAGVGLGDFDNDGLTDIFFSGNEVDNSIYRNLGDLKFEDKTETANINVNKNWASGVSVVDINNDGLLDIYVSQCGPYTKAEDRKNLFYINKGNFEFEESAAKMGLADGNIGTQAAFFDMDKDGDLDVYLLNESKYVLVALATIFEELKDEGNLRAASGKLYRNNGDMTFTDVTKEAGVLEQSFGLGMVVSDFNNDNYPDIYVANDYSVPDRLYINQQNGKFKDEIKKYTNHISFYSMGCDVADINNDGFMELAVVDMATADHYRGKTLMASMDSEAFKLYVGKLNYQYQYMFNAFQLNNGNGTFSNIAGYTGLQKTDWSWAALLTDLNLDGRRDYFVSNGYKRYARDNDFRLMMADIRAKNGGTVPMDMRADVYKKMPSVELRNLLYMNEGDLKFNENPDYFSYPDLGTYSYGTAYGDLDNDGDLELVVNNIDSPAHIIKNNSRENGLGNYLSIKLEHPENSGKVYNSKIKITYGDEIQIAEYAFIRGYESSMDQRVLFGLGDVSKIDKIEILWPDNNLQTISNVNANQELKIVYKAEKQGNFDLTPKKELDIVEINPSELNINYTHQENPFEDFAKEVLLPQKQSTLGPALAVSDVNGDGLDDMFCGGAKGQTASFYLQNNDGTFRITDDKFLKLDIYTEDLDATFADPNKDGTKELLIASGGGGDFEGENQVLHDRFYVLMNGLYSKAKGVIPEVANSTGKIIAEDYNNDGKEDIVICGNAKPGKYPLSEPTLLLSYNGNRYVDVTEQLAPEFKNLHLVRDAVFADINGDNIKDLLTVSEWDKPHVFIASVDGSLKDETNTYISEEKYGWWASVTATDIDNDGDQDFLVGNFGKNLKHKVSDEKPLYIYANDFDKNGTLDVVLAKEYKGKIVPARGRECSSEQMPFITDKFKTYKEFANADINDILGEKSVDEASQYKATTFGSYILRNNNGKLEYEALPSLAQIAPISSSVSYDLNNDGFNDLIIAGNYYDTEYETPRQDAGRGLVLMNKGGKSFEAIPTAKSGLDLNGNFRKIALIKRKNDNLLVATENNGPLKFFKLPS